MPSGILLFQYNMLCNYSRHYHRIYLIIRSSVIVPVCTCCLLYDTEVFTDQSAPSINVFTWFAQGQPNRTTQPRIIKYVLWFARVSANTLLQNMSYCNNGLHKLCPSAAVVVEFGRQCCQGAGNPESQPNQKKTWPLASIKVMMLQMWM